MPSHSVADLYVLGHEYTITDGVRSQKVWLQKLNDVDTQRALHRANGVQAKWMAQFRDEDSDEYGTCVVKASDMRHDVAVDRLIADKAQRIQAAEQSKVALEDEWKENRYLDGLFAAWGMGGMATLAADTNVDDDDPDKIEALRVFSEIRRYNDQVAERVEPLVAIERSLVESFDEDERIEMLLPVIAKEQREKAWMDEFNRCQVWLGVRECTHSHHDFPTFHRKKLWDSRADIDEIQPETFVKLLHEINMLEVPVTEGKDSAATPESSSSSDSPEQPDQEPSSGLAAVGA